MKIHHFILLVLLLVSYKHTAKREVASAMLISPPELTDLRGAITQILVTVEDPGFGDQCVPYLKRLEKKVDGLDVKKISLKEISEDAEEIANISWKVRSTLHYRLSEFDKDCVEQIQANFRQLRFIEDYLLEISRKVTHMDPSQMDFQKQPIPLKEAETFYDVNVNGNEQIEDGDIFVTRGYSFLSGMIARLGKRATQFSHVVNVHEDKKTGQMKTIESYVGVGVAFYDLDYALKNENPRILWLRAKDKELGQKASQLMGAFVQKRIDEKNPVKYDYELNFDDPTTMSCAEVSKVGFMWASNNAFVMPYYPNELAEAKSIVERLKLVPGNTFEPGDLEIDPRFELVGEFRDLRITRDSRQKDAVMTAMFDWMESKNYFLEDTMKSRMAGGIIYDIRRTPIWPLVKKMLKLSDFSKEIPRNMLQTVTIVNDLAGILLKELKEKDLEFEKQYGLPMSYMDFYKVLEEMRVEDLKLYQNKKTRKKAKFHHLIRPR